MKRKRNWIPIIFSIDREEEQVAWIHPTHRRLLLVHVHQYEHQTMILYKRMYRVISPDTDFPIYKIKKRKFYWSNNDIWPPLNMQLLREKKQIFPYLRTQLFQREIMGTRIYKCE